MKYIINKRYDTKFGLSNGADMRKAIHVVSVLIQRCNVNVDTPFSSITLTKTYFMVSMIKLIEIFMFTLNYFHNVHIYSFL